MDLRTLRPGKGVDLEILKAAFEGKDWTARLPTALPETLLLSLAHDFRNVEVCVSRQGTTSEESASSLAVALFMVMSVVSCHPNQKSLSGRIQVSEDALFRALNFYQIGLEREIVSRITGLASSYPDETLGANLLKCLA